VAPLADQQVGGLLMWIPAGALLLVFGLALVAAWVGESERRVRSREAERAAAWKAGAAAAAAEGRR